MATELEKLRTLLAELFQLDAADDLDFGMYRVLRLRRDELTSFLENTLTSEVRRAMGAVAEKERDGITARMRQIEEQAAQFNASPEGNAEYVKLRGLLAEASDASARERQVYAHLAEFFSRYYEDGDFLSLPRMKADTYAIPYDGSEVVLHWANKDQYYVKSGEYFARYAFQLSDGRRVVFRLVDAEVDPDNMKSADAGKRRVILAEADGVKLENGELVCRFVFATTEGKQDAVNKETERRVMDAAPPGWAGELAAEKAGQTSKEKYTTLGWHLRQYVEKNKRDYFIHKDLGGFLRRELDHYLKTEVFDLDSVEAMGADDVSRAVTMVKTVRAVAKPIITFLASIEDFQKRLFLKKKMVLRTDWCITLDRVPEEFYAEIAANKAQVASWKDLFAIEEIPPVLGDSASGETVSVDFLKRNRGLPVETRHFSNDVSIRLLQSFGADIDRQATGILVRGDNGQALRLLDERCRGQVGVVYADPPYNTGSDGFAYKDGYMHSSWASMIADRFALVPDLLCPSGIVLTSISDAELPSLRRVQDSALGAENFVITVVWNTEGNIDNQSRIKGNHEYVTLYARSEPHFEAPKVIDPNIGKDSKLYNDTIENSITKNGPANPVSSVLLPAGFPAAFDEGSIAPGKVEWPRLSGAVEVRSGKTQTDVTASSGWSSRALLDEFIANGMQPIVDSKGAPTWFKITKTGAIYGYKTRQSADQSHVLSVLRNLGTTKQTSGALAAMGFAFDYPKPVGLIQYLMEWWNGREGYRMDFFAGSGTTGEAVLNLNRRDGGHRPFILVEVNDYFDTILLPRILKSTYSKAWKDGRPVDRTPVPGGALYKVLYLESYEDALANITLPPPPSVNPLPFHLQRDYTIRYMLDHETRQAVLDLDRFRKPFGWTMEVRRGGLVTKDHPVDLVETFNYLIGLHVSRYGFFRDANRIRYVEGTVQEDGNDRRVLVLWRDCDLVPDDELVRLFDDREFAPVSSREYDRIYVNGDPPLGNVKRPDEQWKVLAIEDEFKRLSFADVEA